MAAFFENVYIYPYPLTNLSVLDSYGYNYDITDTGSCYHIEVDQTDTITVSADGYHSQTMQILGETTITLVAIAPSISQFSDGTNIYTIKDATAREGLSGKQDTLVSGTNIKTINNNSLLGTGNVNIDSLPSQSGNSGKFLTTNGSAASWATVTIPTVDQTYDSTSTNAQSGVAINGAGFLKNTNTDTTNGLTIQGTTTNVNGIAIGKSSVIGNGSDIAIGKSANAHVDSIAIGTMPAASNQSIAIGAEAMASYDSIAIGTGATATTNYTISIGSFARYSETAYSFNLGFGTNAKTYKVLDGNTGKIPNDRLNSMVGADGTNAGTAGLIPTPSATDNIKFLRGDGTWATAGSDVEAYTAAEIETLWGSIS